VWVAPAERLLKRNPPATAAGEATSSTPLSSPSWPWLFAPQQNARPSPSRAQVWKAPAATDSSGAFGTGKVGDPEQASPDPSTNAEAARDARHRTRTTLRLFTRAGRA